jgi:hypothetical protein
MCRAILRATAALLLLGCAAAPNASELAAELTSLQPLPRDAGPRFDSRMSTWGQPGVDDARGAVVLLDGKLVAIRLDADSPAIPEDPVRDMSIAIHNEHDYTGEANLLRVWRGHALGILVLTARGSITLGDRAIVFAPRPDHRP